jgi:hypothetical protein
VKAAIDTPIKMAIITSDMAGAKFLLIAFFEQSEQRLVPLRRNRRLPGVTAPVLSS